MMHRQDPTAEILVKMLELPDFKMYPSSTDKYPSGFIFEAGGFTYDGSTRCVEEAVLEAYFYLRVRIQISEAAKKL